MNQLLKLFVKKLPWRWLVWEWLAGKMRPDRRRHTACGFLGIVRGMRVCDWIVWVRHWETNRAALVERNLRPTLSNLRQRNIADVEHNALRPTELDCLDGIGCKDEFLQL
jgi:hypothetical protein